MLFEPATADFFAFTIEGILTQREARGNEQVQAAQAITLRF